MNKKKPKKGSKSNSIRLRHKFEPTVKRYIEQIKKKYEKPIVTDNFIEDTFRLLGLAFPSNLDSKHKRLTTWKFMVMDYQCMLQENRKVYGINKEDVSKLTMMFEKLIKPHYLKENRVMSKKR